MRNDNQNNGNMKRFLITLLVLAMGLPMIYAAQKRALLVGISKYRTETRRDWQNIHGSEDVELLVPALKAQGFLVSTLTNEQATRAGIISGLKKLVKKTKKGDIVYIHFSTHGQPVEDGMNGFAADETDGWDEAIVPIDAGSRYSERYDGSKHITDDEINTYVSQIRTKIGPQGALYVVMDACHSGNASRGDFETTRGTNEGLSRSGKKYSFINADNKQHYRLASGSKLAPTVFLEACTSKERNYEITIGKKEYGSLSYMVYLTLKSSKIGTNPASFEKAVKSTISNSPEWQKQLSGKQHVVTETSY